MNGKLTEKMQIDCEVAAASTAASSSLNYDMRMYDQALLAVCLGSTGFTTCTIDIAESSAATVAGTTRTALKAGMTLGAQGGTGITTAGGVRECTLTLGTACTAATYVVQLGSEKRTLTYTTATANLNATAWTTQLYFGSTVGSTVDTGLQLSLDSMSSALNSTRGFNGAFITATNTTATLKLTLKDSAPGPLAIAGGAGLTMTVQQAVGAFNVNAADLDSTANKRYVSIRGTTVGVACAAGITVVRSGGRYMPGVIKGNVST